jgi:hypothetical protein
VESGKAMARGRAHGLALHWPRGVDAWSETTRRAAAGGTCGAAVESPGSRGLGLGDGQLMG